ncbi:MAG: hypothetical protein M3Q07_04905 [Pseudobdellovibrionaceae bacterium]|nr:hypothetical protein [Pseudobdellovibrionaceae bacterium]
MFFNSFRKFPFLVGTFFATSHFLAVAVARADEDASLNRQLLYQCMPGIGTFPIKLNLTGHLKDGLPSVSELDLYINAESNQITVDSQIIEVNNLGLYDGKWISINFQKSLGSRPVNLRIAFPENYTNPWLFAGHIEDFPGVERDTTVSGNGFENVPIYGVDAYLTNLLCHKKF